MGSTGIVVSSGRVRLEPITGGVSGWENTFRRGENEPNIEHGALFDKDGNPVIGYKGDRHSVAIDQRVLQSDGTFTHYHPDKSFGGTLSMQDLRVFARSNLNELRAVSSQGQLYSIKANGNVDRAGLTRWVNKNQKLAQRNFARSYESALKQATTPLKSGPHKGQIKLTNSTTGKVTYRAPMTQQQAVNYARTYSVGMFDRMYRKALDKYGVSYVSTRAGRNSDKRK